jgi:N-acetylglucosaminyldiphosphoundecaprenol N-acetyl-beta-D-mannosaminyltransferase
VTPAAAGAARGSAVEILGVRVHPCTLQEARARIEELLAGPGQHTVIPVNPEMVIAARGNAAFRSAINEASLSLPDGTGVMLALRLHGAGKSGRVPGVDIVEEVASIAARRGLPLFLLGAAPGVAADAGTRLAERHPGLAITGTYAGSPDPGEEAEIRARIDAAKAAILLVAYGAPKQELWIARNMSRTGVRLAMAVGGTFDVLAGRKTRAPRWMQRAGLEWLFRLAQEPRRYRRMLALPEFAARAIMERIKRKS